MSPAAAAGNRAASSNARTVKAAEFLAVDMKAEAEPVPVENRAGHGIEVRGDPDNPERPWPELPSGSHCGERLV
jgi:hypothetical protein